MGTYLQHFPRFGAESPEISPKHVLAAFSREIVQRDGKLQVGLADGASGPFETRAFAEAVARTEALLHVVS